MEALSGPEQLEDTAYAGALLRELKSFYDARLLVDVTLEVDGGSRFLCNRNVLAAASPYFRSMFTGGLFESKQQSVTIHDVDSDSMALIIDYCYTGRVTVCEASVQKLYVAANMLQLDYVRQACAAFMARRLDLYNCAGILKVSPPYLSGVAEWYSHCHTRGLRGGGSYSTEIVPSTHVHVNQGVYLS